MFLELVCELMLDVLLGCVSRLEPDIPSYLCIVIDRV